MDIIKIVGATILMLLVNYIISLLIHWYALIKEDDSKRISEFKLSKLLENMIENNKVLTVINMTIAPDICISKYYKKRIKETDSKSDLYTRYIIKCNQVNLNVAILFLITFIALSLIWGNLYANKYLLCILFIRTISRSYEIGRAFISDIIGNDKKNNSKLKSSDRIRLALKSFLEIILAYCLVYFIIEIIEKGQTGNDIQYIYNTINALYNKLIYSIGVSTLVSVKGLEGISITSFSFSAFKQFLNQIATLLQLLTSMSLFYFALAGYLSKWNADVNKDSENDQLDNDDQHWFL